MKRTLLITCLLTFNIMLSQVTVTVSNDPQDIIQNGLIGNPNFPASNFVLSSGAGFGDVNSVGTFTNAGVDFPLNQGIVLSTGEIGDVPGENTTLLNSGAISWLGDFDLDVILSTTTFNASFISFDFVADVEMISLDFLMASEEYSQNFECSFADSFAFILTNNNTGVSENIALVPNTTTPIAVTTVHAGAGGFCPPINEAYFERYNYDIEDANIPSILATDSPINLNGQTQVFMLMGDLEVGSSYTIKIVIADALDTALDSVLFIKNSSFGAFPVIDSEPSDLVVDDTNEDGFEIFDLTQNESLMLGNIDTNVYSFLFNYYTTQADAEADTNAIVNPEAYMNSSDLEEIYVSMRNAFTGTRITDSFRITIDLELLSVDNLELDAFVLYPNPVVDTLFIDANFTELQNVEVYTINGQLVKSQSNSQNGIAIDFSDLSSGLYLVKLTSENGSVYKRVVK